MHSGYYDVMDFHDKFEVPVSEKPTLLSGEALNFRVKFLQEELDEFKKASEEGNLQEAFDALLDLVYVAYGTSHMMGADHDLWSDLWDPVQKANMSKVRAKSAADSKRGTSLDVVKPKGWKSPTEEQLQVLASRGAK